MGTRIAKLALENGVVFTGTSFGAEVESIGEVCFNTAMTGYQEILTDPSYRGQIVTMTYPLIGNYGVNREDAESSRPWLAGFVVREFSRRSSNFRATSGLDDYLQQHNIPGLAGIDTRRLVRMIRTAGAMKGTISCIDLDDASLIDKARRSPGLIGRDIVREVVPQQPVDWSEELTPWTFLTDRCDATVPNAPLHIVALDFGMKWNIARHLRSLGARVTVLPGTMPADAVLERQPHGVFLSNGPAIPSRSITRSRPQNSRTNTAGADLRHLPRSPVLAPATRREPSS